MVSERNRILELEKYLCSLGIDINIGKTKARGHKGIFMSRPSGFRIDISKQTDSDNVLSVMIHEFAHYIHYKYDKTLKTLDFIFDDFSDELREELIRITVMNVPKEFATSLYSLKDRLNKEIKDLSEIIKLRYPSFKLTQRLKDIENSFSVPLRYLLKYDNVNYFNKIYSVNNLGDLGISEEQKAYIELKSKQRCLKRINSKISRLNKYYNNPSELFARFVELYYINPLLAKEIAPLAFEKMSSSEIPQLLEVERILK